MDDFALPAWVIEIVKQVGPFAVLLIVMFWYVPRKAVSGFILSQRDQAVAMGGIKDALTSIAERGSRLDEKIDEVLINQRLFVARLEGLKEIILNGRQSA